MATNPSAESNTKSPEPNTLITDTNAPVTKPKKKGKSKGSRAQKLKEKRAKKALEHLNKLASQYKAEQGKYDAFVTRIDKWFSENSPKIVGLFAKFDMDSCGELTYDQFKGGMIDVNIPCNLIELHLLTTLLDADGNQRIDYAEFVKGVRYFSHLDAWRSGHLSDPPCELSEKHRTAKNSLVEVEASANGTLDEEADKFQLIGTSETKWVRLSFRFVVFESETKHPGHFREILPLTTYVSSLASIIRERTQILSMSVELYMDNTKSVESRMDPFRTIRDYGFHGGPSYDPRDLVIYYDYFVGDVTCPILYSDYYFSQSKKTGEKQLDKSRSLRKSIF